MYYTEHGTGRTVVVLHGADVDHREVEACFEPAFSGIEGLRRVYPDLPGMGLSPAPETLRGGDDVFREYFVMHTPEMLERYGRYVAPTATSSTRLRPSGWAHGGR